VTFDIDANGILKVSAHDKATGRTQDITITASSGLSDEEVEKMQKEAEVHAEEDQKRRGWVEAHNNAENATYGAEKALKDLGDKVPADTKTKVEDAIGKVRELLEGEDTEALTKATDELMQEVQAVGAAAYQPAGEPVGSAPEEKGSGNGEDDGENVVEGEFKEADDGDE
jgi:molecular chaperone DnaK